MRMYLVGGAVRDELLGVTSKDYDYTVELESEDFPAEGTVVKMPTPFDVMRDNLMQMGFKIFLETPEHLTVRAQFPKQGSRSSGGARNRSALDGRFVKSGLTADFVLARKEGEYSDGRRPDSVEIGTLEDDLARRDFTMNAIAKAPDGTLIDPFKGVSDINDRVIRAVGSAFDRLTEDALRALRALRFSVTKGFRIDKELEFAMETHAVLEKIENNISDERIREELNKMFKFNTLESLKALGNFPALTAAVFAGRVSLEATMKQRGRGK